MLLAADRLRAEDAREKAQAQLQAQPASPRPWGVSVTPSVRLIPPESDRETDDDLGRSAPSTAARPESPRPEPARAESARAESQSKPTAKSRPAGKPRKPARASSSSQRQGRSGAKPAGSASSSSSASASVRSSGGAASGSAVKPGAAARSTSGKSSGRSSRKGQPPPSRFRSLDSTGNVRVLSAEDIADLAEDARPPAAGRTSPGPMEPGRSVTGTARPAQTVRPSEGTGSGSRWPGYPMADYQSPSGASYGGGNAQADPVAAAAESATSFAELATVLNKARFASTGPVTLPATEPVADSGSLDYSVPSADPPSRADLTPPAGAAPLPASTFSSPAAPAPMTASAPVATSVTPATEGTVSAAEETGAVEKAALPIAGYDELSLPSLRARLRNLDVEQLQVIVDYERTHANRADVVTMFERRIVKLNDGSA